MEYYFFLKLIYQLDKYRKKRNKYVNYILFKLKLMFILLFKDLYQIER